MADVLPAMGLIRRERESAGVVAMWRIEHFITGGILIRRIWYCWRREGRLVANLEERYSP
jgi:hypothetical protein